MILTAADIISVALYFPFDDNSGDHVELSIRNAEKDDIEGIMRIERESFHINIAECRKTFLERIRIFPDGFLVMEIDGELAGYISSELWEYSENLDNEKFIVGHSITKTHQEDGKELYISSIGVLEKYRSKGYGNAIFSELEKRILCKYLVQSIILIVSDDWCAAKNIYEKSGFRQIHVIPGFFYGQSHSTAIVMRKKLEASQSGL